MKWEDVPELQRERARELRRNQTDVERQLWNLLRRRFVGPCKFRRQHPVGPYVVDFFSVRARLVVELDGDQHATPEAMAYDLRRTRFLEARGLRVLRFGNRDWLEQPEAVLSSIHHAVTAAGPSP